MASPVERTVRRSRAQVRAAEQDTVGRIGAAYQQVSGHLRPRITAFVGRYAAAWDAVRAAAQGEGGASFHVPATWLHAPDGGDYPHLAAIVTGEMRAFGRTAFGVTALGKIVAADIGGEGARQAMQAAVGPIAHLLPSHALAFRRPNEAAVAAFVNRAKDGSPLATLFDSFGPSTADALRQTLTTALALGVNPRQVAFDALRTLDGVGYGRAVTIARTEMLHAWNSAALANYRANRDVVQSWQWMADKGAVTCAACLAMDGSIHDLDEDLDDHPNGRCAKAPVTRGYADILADYGIEASDDEFGAPPWRSYQSGADWLAEQDAETQRAVFGGTAAYNAYKAGDASLDDYAAVRRDGQWGDSIQQASLRSMGLDASDYSDE